MDLAVYIALVVFFAVFLTAHAALAFGLTVRAPHWRGPVGLIVAPLAPYWGFKAGLRGRSILWVVSFFAYAAALAAGSVIGAR